MLDVTFSKIDAHSWHQVAAPGDRPQEGAPWVQYANVTKGYGVKYWEIGNEQYGDGIYGAN